MELEITLDDIKPEWIGRMRQILRYEFAEEIKKAVKSGLDRQTAEDAVIDGYLNTHNFSTKLKSKSNYEQ